LAVGTSIFYDNVYNEARNDNNQKYFIYQNGKLYTLWLIYF